VNQHADPSAGAPTPAALTAGEVVRFDLNERLVHWTTALLLVSLVVTGTILYVPSLMLKVGHRATIVNIHVITGLALIAPLVIGLAGPWRARLTDDLRRLDRWSHADRSFFRRHDGTQIAGGKFNGGQKLASALFGGGMVVMIGTGIVMRWSPPFPNGWASGATLVHDTIYLLLFVLVVGHVVVALSRPVQLRSMFSGRVPARWAEHHCPSWLTGADLARPGPRRRRATSPPPRAHAPRAGAAPAGTTPASD
jgi:formate dehydrogenase subunit gamma